MVTRTRMAPSPTGEFHIGSMRTLLYNYALAKRDGGAFILRIEDTDRERHVEGATERLIEVIKDYNLNWDEGPDIGGPNEPYIQSQRLEIYTKYALELVNSGHAYYCFCTKERLDRLREEQRAQGLAATRYDKLCTHLTKEEVAQKLSEKTSYVIRLNVPANETVSFTDEILGTISFPTNDIDDQVLLKSDGYPTYHLGVVIDDHLMGINVIMRGVEWLPSTPKHILLYRAFGWNLPRYGHLPLLKEIGENKKLSKRVGAVGSVEFLNDGYLPEALLNFLMFLGWNPGTEKEIYSLEEFIADFSLEKVHKTDLVVFDRDKLSWYNGYYIRNLETTELYTRLTAWAEKFNKNLLLSDNQNTNIKVLELVKERMKTLSDFNILTNYFFKAPLIDLDLLLKQVGDKERTKEILQSFLTTYEEVTEKDWNSAFLDELSHSVLEKKGYKPKEAFMTLRVGVTGSTTTPPLFDVLEVLGQKETIFRMKEVLKML